MEHTPTAPTIATDNEPLVLVVDIPAGATTDEAARLWNGPFAGGYYLNAVVPWPGVGARAFLRRQAKPAAKPPKPDPADVPLATREARAVQFIRENREMPVSQLVAALKALRFVRGTQWVTTKRREIIQAEMRARAAAQ